jgi:lipopolysaccharide transport system permease protein
MFETQVADPPLKILELHAAPTKRVEWLKEIWSFREVIGILARKDFQVKYKRASFGVIWAVALPLIQAIVFVVIFSRVGHFHHTTFNYSAYVLAGVLAYGYFQTAGMAASTSIVDGATMTDKVWFPRSILVLVPCLSNLFTLVTTMVILLVAMPIVGAPYTWRLVVLIPAMLLLVVFAISFGLCAASLHVYYRDVKFIVQAGLLILFYVTPIVYPASSLHSIGPYFAYNPLTGIMSLFQFAAAGSFGGMLKPLIVTGVVTVVLFVLGLEGNRRHDRLFVDKL